MNCSTQISGTAVDSAGLHTYTCCQGDLCNTLPGLQLAQEIGGPDAEAERPSCARSYVPWQFSLGLESWNANATVLPHLQIRDAIGNRFEASLNATKASDLGGQVETVQNDLRSKWTLGVQPPTAEDYIFTRDPSPPGCYRITGFIKSGFCGPRSTITSEGDPPLYELTGEVDFGGKYEIQACAGSKTEALAIGNDFAVSGRHITYMNCFEAMKSSSLENDCLQMRGRYNIAHLTRTRRSLLPDCCANYVHQEEEIRKRCRCRNRESEDPVCQEICCCEDALTALDTDACRILNQFIEINHELEKHVNRQCCATRMMSQCAGSDGQCSDAEYDSGKLESLNVVPMCCQYCYDFYDEICSYEGFQNGARVFVQMKTKTNLPLLEELCKQRGCRDTYPCSYEGFSRAALTATPMPDVAIVLAVGVSLVLSLAPPSRDPQYALSE
eukprot:CAMPEP_0181307464 /NCGR_PEP_ID=MMETSP1101-20121128/10897_1 /TAXON_ID=46948 /ORGANISM="Rhodomonas abbreviata, Strain Caron Lab Isolate" /LENGTH=441 /DNA_ID=CAMNT_0023413689 /DNA_START=341 /DNA_END=1667 /DNA_ORIENTATION=-